MIVRTTTMEAARDAAVDSMVLAVIMEASLL